MQLNAMQEIAVNHGKGPCLVVAGPGSGKTKVLTLRVAKLINTGVPAEKILVITFTKAAAIEMKERFNGLWDSAYPVTFGTFHSLFWGILQKEKGYKSSEIISGTSRSKLLKEAMEKADIDIDDSILVNTFASELSSFNNKSLHLDEYVPKFCDKDDFIKLFHSYEELKRKYRMIDFDDMLKKTYQLFLDNPEVLKKWQGRFEYFLVDEMQDMNSLQFKLISMLSANTNNLFCVGDDDQSIYGFRGADPRIMQDFVEAYPDTKKVVLNVNYRNPRNLVEMSARLIGNNKNRFEKEIEATSAEGDVISNMFMTPKEEAEWVCQMIQEQSKAGISPNEMAILYRNHSDARYIISELMARRIPFYLKEQMPNVFTHFIIQDIEAYFHLAIGNGTRTRMLRILNRPVRYLHRQSVETTGFKGMLDFYKNSPSNYRTVEGLISDIKLMSKMSPYAAINYLKKAMGYESFLRQEAIENDGDFVEFQGVLDFISETVRECKTIKQAIDKINMMRLKVDFENKNKSQTRAGKVGLYTLHASKGLEFENVFIIQANEGIIPTNKVETIEDLEAERRLFYVGITRCKRRLYITYTNKINRDKSRFISELKLDHSSSDASARISSKRAETVAYSSSESILSREGVPSSSSKYL
ncbi:MAG: ATP-dependent helicase [Pseudobutyrivibrio sp.]|nr:ATP-dependent helicase [Pseudobutyrivibrio sp.]